MTIGDRMRARRLELGLSQEEVAIKLGYKSRSSVNKMENSRTLPINKVERAAIVLECTPAYLMGWDDYYSDEITILAHDMPKDELLMDLYFHWQQLSDVGKKKLIDNASDLAKIYKKKN